MRFEKLVASGACLAAIAVPLAVNEARAQSLSGVGAPFEPVTFTIDGPEAHEREGRNPFADMRLDVTIRADGQSWTVPGYFAGCEDAAVGQCESGTVWRAHFLPPANGTYKWRLRFREGTDVAVGSKQRSNPLPGNGATGEFTVSGQSADPVRNRGLLHYTGERFYRFSGDGSVFFKNGPDAPENMLAYSGFDDTPNRNNLRKDWTPHERDLSESGRAKLWNGKGAGLLGMFDYLADSGVNTVSMLLWNTGGDDRNVVPHLLAVPEADYVAMKPAEQWASGVVQDRFDLSKLAQWERALSHADARGLHLHFKLQEVEINHFMDGGALGRTRSLYLREMVARFGHFLALTWNVGEENTQDAGDQRMIADYLDGLDAYDRPIVLHTYPNQKERYRPLLGTQSAFNGFSMQGSRDHFNDVRPDIVDWTTAAELAGKPMVASYDEPGGAQGGAGVDPDYPEGQLPSKAEVRIEPERFLREVLWNTLTAGGNGIEAYYGYKTGCTDLNCQDHRTRAQIWAGGAHALHFFNTYVGEHGLSMRAHDGLTNDNKDYVFAEPGERYVIVPGEGENKLHMAGLQGRFAVRWFDRLQGGDLQTGSVAMIEGGEARVDFGAPPAGGSGAWVALIEREQGAHIHVEAEDFASQSLDEVRRWYRIDSGSTEGLPQPDHDPAHWQGASGGAYLEALPDTRITHGEKLIVGENFSDFPGKMAILSYDVDFPSAGRWYVWVRTHSTGSEDNGLHVGLNGEWPESGQRLQWCSGKDRWYWDSRRRTDLNHCGTAGAIWLDVPEAGRHTVQFSLREDGFEFDAFALTQSPQRPAAFGPALAAVPDH